MFLRLCSLPWHRLEKQVFGGEEEWDIGCEGAWLGERLDLCLSRVLYSPKPAGTDALCLQLLGRSLTCPHFPSLGVRTLPGLGHAL